jgi:hypothetical protein
MPSVNSAGRFCWDSPFGSSGGSARCGCTGPLRFLLLATGSARSTTAPALTR